MMDIFHLIMKDWYWEPGNGVALEVNNSHVKYSWRKGTLENIRTYLELCMKYRVPIFVGSDAHDPCQIGNFDEAIALVDEFGFDKELIINNDEDKFRAFIKSFSGGNPLALAGGRSRFLLS